MLSALRYWFQKFCRPFRLMTKNPVTGLKWVNCTVFHNYSTPLLSAAYLCQYAIYIHQLTSFQLYSTQMPRQCCNYFIFLLQLLLQQLQFPLCGGVCLSILLLYTITEKCIVHGKSRDELIITHDYEQPPMPPLPLPSIPHTTTTTTTRASRLKIAGELKSISPGHLGDRCEIDTRSG